MFRHRRRQRGYDMPRLLEDVLGLNSKSSAAIPAAPIKIWPWNAAKCIAAHLPLKLFSAANRFHLGEEKLRARAVANGAASATRNCQDVPTIWELMDQYKVPESKRRMASVYLNSGLFGSRPIVSTPGVIGGTGENPARRLHSKTLKDPDFLGRGRPSAAGPSTRYSGEELQALAKEVTSQPPEVIEWLKKLLAK